jgi:hypothetical protein
VLLGEEEIPALEVTVSHLVPGRDRGAVQFTTILESSGFSAISTEPSYSGNWPRTFESICRATNENVVCALSNSHLPAGGTLIPFTVLVSVVAMSFPLRLAGLPPAAEPDAGGNDPIGTWYSRGLGVRNLLPDTER